jgi:hypothetical protein
MSTTCYWYSPRPSCCWDSKSCPHRLADMFTAPPPPDHPHHVRRAAAQDHPHHVPLGLLLCQIWCRRPSPTTMPGMTSTVPAPSSPVIAWLRPDHQGRRDLLISADHPLRWGFVIDWRVQGHHWWWWEVNSSESWFNFVINKEEHVFDQVIGLWCVWQCFTNFLMLSNMVVCCWKWHWMSFIYVIVIYLDNGAGNCCISSNFGFFLECTLVHVFFYNAWSDGAKLGAWQIVFPWTHWWCQRIYELHSRKIQWGWANIVPMW